MILSSWPTLWAVFWRRYPALLYGIGLLLGLYAALAPSWILALPVALIYLPLALPPSVPRGRFRLITSLACAISLFLFASDYYTFPRLPAEGVSGTTTFSITEVLSGGRYTRPSWQYRGVIEEFTQDDTGGCLAIRHMPASLFLSPAAGEPRPIAGATYRIHGTILSGNGGGYLLHPDKGRWEEIGTLPSMAEWRYQAKERLASSINAHIASARSAAFLRGLATGRLDDPELHFELGRFGLQHIMAISGFHFALMAALFSSFLRLIFPRRPALFLLLSLLAGYALFIGLSPSICRAWVAVTAVIIGSLIERRPSGLNTLGIALIATLLFEPLFSLQLSFQLSFLCTASILLFYHPFERILQTLWPRLSLAYVVEMPRHHRHAYALLNILRGCVALTAAVHVAALPMTLFAFQQFPLLSLVYNLFYPLLAAVAMILLVIAIGITAIAPPLADALYAPAEAFTEWMLQLAYNLPTRFDVSWHQGPFPPGILVAYLSLLFAAGITLTTWRYRHEDSPFLIIF